MIKNNQGYRVQQLLYNNEKMCTRCKCNQTLCMFGRHARDIQFVWHNTQLQHSMDIKQYEKPYKFEDNRNLKASQGCRVCMECKNVRFVCYN